MKGKIFSFIALIVSISAFITAGAFYINRLENELPVYPVIFLLITTLLIVVVCAINHFTYLSDDITNDTTEQSEKEN